MPCRRWLARAAVAAAAFVLCAAAPPPAAAEPSLSPSRASLMRQVEEARAHRFSHLETAEEVHAFVRAGLLVRLGGDAHYEVKDDVDLPFARPAVKSYVEDLAARVHRACDMKLMVTSLVRPRDEQPRNASPLSVHPTGMAFDLRLPWGRCRLVLERELLEDEAAGLVEAARERRPPHYHVVLFPDRWSVHRIRQLTLAAAGEAAAEAAPRRHRVRRGETLWKIASRYDTTVAALRRTNGLRSSVIRPGQWLEVPPARPSRGDGAATARRR